MNSLARNDIIPAVVPMIVLLLAALAALAAWYGIRRQGRRRNPPASWWWRLAPQTATGTCALWLCYQVLHRGVSLRTQLPLPLLALFGAGAIETALLLYGHECNLVSRRKGTALILLRVSILACILFMLAEPVHERFVMRRLDRHVVLLQDVSDSMRFSDPQMSAAERLELYAIDNPTPQPLLNLLAQAFDALRVAEHQLSAATETLRVIRLAETAASADASERSTEQFNTAASSLAAASKAIATTIEELHQALGESLSPAYRELSDSISQRCASNIPAALAKLEEELRENTGDTALRQESISSLTAELLTNVSHLSQAAIPLMDAFASATLEQLPVDQRKAADALAEVPRSQFADALLYGTDSRQGLIDELMRRYTVHRILFSSRPSEVPAGETSDIVEAAGLSGDSARRTDISKALDFVLSEIPEEGLAGAVLLSDFQHNGQEGLSAAARSLGARGAPIFTIPFGSQHSFPDMAIMNVEAPQAILQGDRLGLKVHLKCNGFRGQEATLTLAREGQIIETRTFPIPEDEYRNTLRLNDVPPEGGITRYTLTLVPAEIETVTENNTWQFETAVSEDRTNVLLIDRRPRWEFRYLRNLFFGRDKSVHLQYVLTMPDHLPVVEDAAPSSTPHVNASASRPFGDAEADRLPADLSEWRKFDVIILGDLSPETLTEPVLEMIHDCVSERGAALVVIAGPEAMPHRYTSQRMRELLPVLYNNEDVNRFESPGGAFHIQLTPEGRRHPIMQLSPSVARTEALWESLPLTYWRQSVLGVKPGAAVLAYAALSADRAEQAALSDMNVETALRRIKAVTEAQARNSLIVIQPYGMGKVMMLNFDRTWRLRYRIGDIYHHRFWGQVLNWGAGENLRAGTPWVRLGTDRIRYAPGDAVKVIARVLQTDYTPVSEAKISVVLTREGDKVSTRRLNYRPQSQGIYEANVGPFQMPGRYQLELQGAAVTDILQESSAPPVQTDFIVEVAHNPVELSTFTADHALAEQIATLSGGRLLRPSACDELETAFGPATETLRERADVTLWDHWLLLMLMLMLLTSEWLLRRKGGLP